jgi:hypothetical protein
MNKRTERILIVYYACIALIIITLALSGVIHAQKRGIDIQSNNKYKTDLHAFRNKDTILPHYYEIVLYDTYADSSSFGGYRYQKVAYIENGKWVIVDSMRTIEVLYRELKKTFYKPEKK